MLGQLPLLLPPEPPLPPLLLDVVVGEPDVEEVVVGEPDDELVTVVMCVVVDVVVPAPVPMGAQTVTPSSVTLISPAGQLGLLLPHATRATSPGTPSTAPKTHVFMELTSEK
jgi:hypothetical protein